MSTLNATYILIDKKVDALIHIFMCELYKKCFLISAYKIIIITFTKK